MSLTPATNPINVMLVDDSAVIRGFIARILEQDEDIKVVRSVSNGKMGVDTIKATAPDVVLLDIEMPVMDGITALPLLLKEYPSAKIIICSTLSSRNADISIKALSLGAADCILKPSSGRELVQKHEFKRDLINLVRSLSGRPPRFLTDAAPGIDKPATSTQPEQSSHAPVGNADAATSAAPGTFRRTIGKEVVLQAGPMVMSPTLLAIGSSTGGPKALFEVLKHCKDIHIPIVITQHMPKTFTKILAQHIQQHTGIESFEAEDMMKLENGKAYVAPGGFHMTLVKDGGNVIIRTTEDPPENFCRPSVEPMLRTALKIYGNKMLTVILTGMGHDGVHTCKEIVDAGGSIIAQDKHTSVVWGMPGAVAEAGLCKEVLPVENIGPRIRKIIDNK